MLFANASVLDGEDRLHNGAQFNRSDGPTL
jgi:hypothetical protein